MTLSPPSTLLLHPDDSVAVAVRDLSPGEPIEGVVEGMREPVPIGHKVAVKEIAPGEPLLKYGQIIGVALRRILPGEHVHTHNLGMADLPMEAAPEGPSASEGRPPVVPDTFKGIRRPDGRVATRNYLGILATSGCAGPVAARIAAGFGQEALGRFPHVDGVVPLIPKSGCGMGAQGEDLRLLQRTLRGYAVHPNFASVLVVGLGCEVNHVDGLLEGIPLKGFPIRTLVIQECGGSAKAIQQGRDMVREMLEDTPVPQRVPVPARALKVGLECGGSDAYSGITANPALGWAMDLLVRQGGTAILEKSLGAVAKAGSTRLRAVYEYAEPVTASGLVFMDTPGYDPVSVTGMIAGGALLVCFPTGRGTGTGSVPAPTLK